MNTTITQNREDKRKAASEEHRLEYKLIGLSQSAQSEKVEEFLDLLDRVAERQAITIPLFLIDLHPIRAHFPSIIDWLNELLPWSSKVYSRVTRIVEKAGSTESANSDPELCEIEDDFGNARCHEVEAAFALGVLAGAKMAGYPAEKLRRLAKTTAETISQ